MCMYKPQASIGQLMAVSGQLLMSQNTNLDVISEVWYYVCVYVCE